MLQTRSEFGFRFTTCLYKRIKQSPFLLPDTLTDCFMLPWENSNKNSHTIRHWHSTFWSQSDWWKPWSHASLQTALVSLPASPHVSMHRGTLISSGGSPSSSRVQAYKHVYVRMERAALHRLHIILLSKPKSCPHHLTKTQTAQPSGPAETRQRHREDREDDMKRKSSGTNQSCISSSPSLLLVSSSPPQF